MAEVLELKERADQMNELPDFQNVVLIIGGGIGKNIAATSVVSTIKKQYPNKKVIVIVSHPDVWLYHPDVHRIYNFANALNIYDDYFGNSLILGNEPYLSYGYTVKQKHLIDAYTDMWKLEKAEHKPIVHFLKREIIAAKNYLKKIDEDFNKVIMFQWLGGWMAPYQQCNCAETDYETRLNIGQLMAYRRSISKDIAQEIVNKLKDDFTILTIEGPEYPKLENTKNINSPIRSVLALIPHIKSFIGVDSFLQHASAAFGKKGLVLWGGTSPDCLGYEHNDNFYMEDCCPTPFCHRPNSYFFDNQGGYNWNCKHDEPCLDFDPDEVVERFLKLVNKES